MKIKVVLLESDHNYLSKITSAFNAKFSDKIEIYSFTEKTLALSTLEKERVHVFIVAEDFEIDSAEIPKNCTFVYFVNSPDISSMNNQRTICKFQKVDVIYRQIFDIYSETVGNIVISKSKKSECKVIAFSSPAGGVGTSTMAAACAIRYARQGKKVLYFNIEKLGSADAFFSADGSFNMSDVIFSLKSKKANLAFKLESYVKQDKSNVYFFSQAKFALDMAELTGDDWIQLIEELESTGTYEYIIVDMDFILDEDYLKLYEYTSAVIWVNSGTNITNGKTYRALQACRMIEQEKQIALIEKIHLIYNKFSNKTCRSIDKDLGIESEGGVPRFSNIFDEQLVERLSNLDIFDKLV